jgi:hypothetical protein
MSGEDLEITLLDIVESGYSDVWGAHVVKYVRKYELYGNSYEDASSVPLTQQIYERIDGKKVTSQEIDEWKIWAEWPKIGRETLHSVPSVAWRIGGKNVGVDDVVVRYMADESVIFKLIVRASVGNEEVFVKEVDSPVPGDEVIIKDLAIEHDSRLVVVGYSNCGKGGILIDTTF